MLKNNEKLKIATVGGVIGIAAIVLVLLGNPRNMGFCIACFIRDTMGALHFHSASVVQYVRPEVIGLVLGSFILSIVRREFSPRGGSSPVLRFIIGAMVMIGALAFLGCPLRLVLRLAAGDLNALVGLFGFVFGIAIGAYFLNQGFSLGRYQKQSSLEGVAFPGLQIALFLLLVLSPSLLAFSSKGPGSMHAPLVISLFFGLLVGALSQHTRFCMVGGFRDLLLVKDSTLFIGFAALFVVNLIGNLLTGSFLLSFSGQSIAHSAHLWNFLGMFVVGLGSVMLGGCPLRQLILAGEGNSDSAIAVLGMAFGAALSHNFSLAGVAANATSKGGVGINGKVAVVLSIIALFAIAAIRIAKERKGVQR